MRCKSAFLIANLQLCLACDTEESPKLKAPVVSAQPVDPLPHLIPPPPPEDPPPRRVWSDPPEGAKGPTDYIRKGGRPMPWPELKGAWKCQEGAERLTFKQDDPSTSVPSLTVKSWRFGLKPGSPPDIECRVHNKLSLMQFGGYMASCGGESIFDVEPGRFGSRYVRFERLDDGLIFYIFEEDMWSHIKTFFIDAEGCKR